MWQTVLIKWAIKILQSQLVARIEFEPLRKLVQRATDTLGKVTNIVIDKDPNNKAQFEQLWNETKGDLLDEGIDRAIEIIEAKMKNSVAKNIIISLLRELDEAELIGPVAKI